MLFGEDGVDYIRKESDDSQEQISQSNGLIYDVKSCFLLLDRTAGPDLRAFALVRILFVHADTLFVQVKVSKVCTKHQF